LGNIADVTGFANHSMHEAGVGIDTNMRLHAEVLLIAILALVHLRITLTGLVLGRGWRRNQCRIDNHAFPQKQAFLCQMVVDGVED
jgi:hypothetical protein